MESETLGADKCSRFNTALTPQFIKIQKSRKFFLPNHHPVPILNRRRMVRLKPVTLTRNNRSLFMCFGEVNRLDTTVIKAHVEPVSGSKKNSDRLFFLFPSPSYLVFLTSNPALEFVLSVHWYHKRRNIATLPLLGIENLVDSFVFSFYTSLFYFIITLCKCCL